MPINLLGHDTRVMDMGQFMRMTPKAQGTGLKNWIRVRLDMDRGARLTAIDEALYTFHAQCTGGDTHLGNLEAAAHALVAAIDAYVSGKGDVRNTSKAVRVAMAQLLRRQVSGLLDAIRAMDALGGRRPERVEYMDSRDIVREWRSAYFTGLGTNQRVYGGNPYLNPDRDSRPRMSPAEVEILRGEVDYYNKRDAYRILAEMAAEARRRQ